MKVPIYNGISGQSQPLQGGIQTVTANRNDYGGLITDAASGAFNTFFNAGSDIAQMNQKELQQENAAAVRDKMNQAHGEMRDYLTKQQDVKDAQSQFIQSNTENELSMKRQQLSETLTMDQREIFDTVWSDFAQQKLDVASRIQEQNVKEFDTATKMGHIKQLTDDSCADYNNVESLHKNLDAIGNDKAYLSKDFGREIAIQDGRLAQEKAASAVADQIIQTEPLRAKDYITKELSRYLTAETKADLIDKANIAQTKKSLEVVNNQLPSITTDNLESLYNELSAPDKEGKVKSKYLPSDLVDKIASQPGGREDLMRMVKEEITTKKTATENYLTDYVLSITGPDGQIQRSLLDKKHQKIMGSSVSSEIKNMDVSLYNINTINWPEDAAKGKELYLAKKEELNRNLIQGGYGSKQNGAIVSAMLDKSFNSQYSLDTKDVQYKDALDIAKTTFPPPFKDTGEPNKNSKLAVVKGVYGFRSTDKTKTMALYNAAYEDLTKQLAGVKDAMEREKVIEKWKETYNKKITVQDYENQMNALQSRNTNAKLSKLIGDDDSPETYKILELTYNNPTFAGYVTTKLQSGQKPKDIWNSLEKISAKGGTKAQAEEFKKTKLSIDVLYKKQDQLRYEKQQQENLKHNPSLSIGVQ